MSDDDNNQSNSDSGELGRITPKKMAKELTPLEREALRKQQEQYYAGEVVSDLDSLMKEASKQDVPSGADTTRASQKSEIKEPEYAEGFVGEPQERKPRSEETTEEVQQEAQRSQARVGTFIVLGLGLICAIWILVWLLPLISKESDFEEQQEAATQYSHVQIRQKPEDKLDLSGALGVLKIGEENFALRVVSSRLFIDKQSVEVSFYENESSAEPIIKVVLAFAAGAKNANPETLSEYTVMRVVGDNPFMLKKEYSRRLSTHEEVSELGGVLKEGTTFRAAMKDSRLDPVSGKKVSWDFRFESLLTESLQVR